LNGFGFAEQATFSAMGFDPAALRCFEAGNCSAAARASAAIRCNLWWVCWPDFSCEIADAPNLTVAHAFCFVTEGAHRQPIKLPFMPLQNGWAKIWEGVMSNGKMIALPVFSESKIQPPQPLFRRYSMADAAVSNS
jgi:hypothetical protein